MSAFDIKSGIILCRRDSPAQSRKQRVGEEWAYTVYFGFSLDKDSVQVVKEAKTMVYSTCRAFHWIRIPSNWSKRQKRWSPQHVEGTIEFQFDDLENLEEQESDLRPMETKCSTVDE